MTIIEIEQLNNFAHRNQTCVTGISVPDGWVVIPDDMNIPDSFPFVDIVVENNKLISMSPRIVPEPTPEPEQPPTEIEQLRADIDYISAVMGVEL